MEEMFLEQYVERLKKRIDTFQERIKQYQAEGNCPDTLNELNWDEQFVAWTEIGMR